MLSLDKASPAEQDTLMDVAGVGLCHSCLNREVIFTEKAWKSKYMFFRENTPFLIREVKSYTDKTIKYWEESKDKLI